MSERIAMPRLTYLLATEIEGLAHELLKELPISRVHSWDVEVVVKLLMDVYNVGRARGAYEMSGGATCS